mgnify:CR=1 FL=1
MQLVVVDHNIILFGIIQPPIRQGYLGGGGALPSPRRIRVFRQCVTREERCQQLFNFRHARDER